MSVAILSPEQYQSLVSYGIGCFIGLREGASLEAGRVYTPDEITENFSEEEIDLALGAGDLFTFDGGWWDGGLNYDITYAKTPNGEDIVVVEYCAAA